MYVLRYVSFQWIHDWVESFTQRFLSSQQSNSISRFLYLAERFSLLTELFCHLVASICHDTLPVSLCARYIYSKAVEALAVSTTVESSTIFDDHEESMVIVVPAFQSQVFELGVRHVSIHVVVIDVFEIYIILSKDHQQINIVAHQMLWNLRVRLTKIETINVLVSPHTVESSIIVLFLASYFVKYDDRIGTSICHDPI